MYSDAPVSDTAIGDALTRVWGVDAAAVTYERVGYGSFHWTVMSADGRRWFVTADSYDSPFPLVAAYSLARRLADGGLEFVRAPMATAAGSVAWPIDRWWLSLWPWLEGRSSTSHDHQCDADLASTLAIVRRLHEHRGTEPDPALIENWVITGREDLWARVDAGGDGPYAADVSRRARIHRPRIEAMFARYDELIAAISRDGVEFVITHGEPHAANVVHTDSGAMLIDWDTVRWAPRERDLWSLTDYDGWDHAYGWDAVSADALEVYRLQWDLSEITDFVTSLLASPAADTDTEVAMRVIREYLPG